MNPNDSNGAGPDTSSAEAVKKTIHDIFVKQKEIVERGGEQAAKTEGFDARLADLTVAVRELNESRKQRPTHYGNSDKDMRKYVDKEKGLRVMSEWDDVGLVGKGLLDDKPCNEWQAKLQHLSEQRNWVRHYSKHSVSPKTDKMIERHMAHAPDVIAKLFGDGAGVGAEWIPVQHLPILEEELRGERRVEALFDVTPMSNKNERMPFLSVGLRPYKKGVPISDDPGQFTSSSLVTAEINIDAVGFAVRAQLDEDASEDAIVNTQAIIRSEHVAAIVDGSEDAIINGDTTAAHQDAIATWDIRSRWGAAGLGGAADHRRVWKGLRRRAVDVSATVDQSGAQSAAGAATLRSSMDSPHGAAGNLAYITSPEYALLKMTQFAELLTLDKFGPNATILTGQVASLYGIPVIMSEFVGKDLNDSGLFDDITTDKTALIIVNRSRFRMGMRRQLAVEMDKDITRGVIETVSTVRKIFFTLDTATKKNLFVGFKLSTT